jgi:SAM-dependent methyltransferase
LRKRGVAGTVKFVAVAAAKSVWSRYVRGTWDTILNKRFDWRFGVETAGGFKFPETDPRFEHSTAYAATTHSVFFRMLRQIDVDHRKFLFIDFGCGKGKALLLAAELPFKQIIGVELSPTLIRVAEENWKRYRGQSRKCNSIQLICKDAGEFPVPHEPAIYYLFNPFFGEVVCKVLENIRRSLAAAPREIYVVYLTPEHRSLLDESGFLTPIKQSSEYRIYKTSGAQLSRDEGNA